MNSEKEINPASVLIVDDNVRNLQVLGGFLKNEGIEAEFAIDGISAFDWLGKKKFDLILLDVMMPGMDGFEVCTKIKNNPMFNDISVIFITAKTDTESIIKGFKTGAVDYITKPFIKSELIARIETHLNIIKSKQLIIGYLNKIEEKNKDIKYSIEYARNIQNAVLNATEVHKENLPRHFILNIPKDILSGDFCWMNIIDETAIFAIMDCTGHGVPGALMSILGNTLLNETVTQDKVIHPDKILEHLRKKLIRSLGQNQVTISVKDAIEGSVISYNPESGVLNFSGTLNPIIHISDNKMNVIKADRIPIGFYEKQAAFSLKTFKINKGDIIYLFTDGYFDQFGGPDTKKIMSKRFRELLFRNHNLPLRSQKIKLIDYLKWWQKDEKQTDDILIVGIQF
jgi:sigma-B regulation protein RsbU (phosphoserine phosphatase)